MTRGVFNRIDELEKAILGSAANLTGIILPYTGDIDKIPQGWYLCDGENGTPDLRDRFLQGSSEAGNMVDAGLPNITATFTMRQGTNNVLLLNKKGCLIDCPEENLWGSIYTNPNTTGTLHGQKIDASVSSSIYGNSETVQPSAYTVCYIMKVADT
jgi:hypothetical protein